MQSALLRPIGTSAQAAKRVEPLPRARLLSGPRSVHFGMQVIGPSGEHLLVLRLHDDGGFHSVTALDLDNDGVERNVPVASLQLM